MNRSPLRKDLVIIGGGIAGLTAAMYASLMSVDFIVFENSPFVGQIPEASLRKNFPGIRNISGAEMARTIEEQVNLDFSVDINREEVVDIVMNTTGVPYRFLVKTDHDHYLSKAIILATGSRPVESTMDNSTMKGISYRPVFDLLDLKDKDIVIHGINDHSIQYTFWLKDIASTISLFDESTTIDATPMNIHELEKIVEDSEMAIHVHLNHRILAIEGDDHLECIKVMDVESGETVEIPAGAMIISKGRIANSELAVKLECEVDRDGHIIVDRHQRTGTVGVFAAGDVTGIVRTAVKSSGEGCVSGSIAAEYLRTGKW